MNTEPTAALNVAVLNRKTIYPPPFASLVEGRAKHRLGDHFGLTTLGFNLTELAPGSASALLHHHTLQDEFIYIVAGSPTLLLGANEYTLRAGDCCGFKAGTGVGHQLVNRSQQPVLYLEVGDRSPGLSRTRTACRIDAQLAGRPYGSVNPRCANTARVGRCTDCMRCRVVSHHLQVAPAL